MIGQGHFEQFRWLWYNRRAGHGVATGVVVRYDQAAGQAAKGQAKYKPEVY